ncbi:MAG: MATE family efflux transporter [Clostridia bacterium]|nr:MATE family efflux transporter [Clostridia bacterium]
MAKSNTMNMTSGSIMGPLIKYSIPIMLTGILQLLFNTADIIVVGQFVNEKAVAAVSASAALINLLINLFVGTSLGATVVLASTIGAQRDEDISRITHTTFALGIIFGMLTTVVGVIGAEQFLIWMDTPADILAQATLYLKIYFAGNLFFMVYTFGRAIIVAIGDTQRPLIYLTLSGIINVILNVVFIRYFGMGVEGVAIATVISQAVSAVLMTAALIKLDHKCKISLKKLRINGKQLKKILVLGLPVGLQNTLFSLSNVIIQSSVNSLGTLYVAGNGAGNNLDSFVYTSMNSFTQGGMTFAGQNYGAGKYKRVKNVFIAVIECVCVIGIVMGLAVYFNGRTLLKLYLPDSPEGIEYGMVRLLIMGVFNFLCGLMDCSSGILRGMNKSVFPMIATVGGSCGLRIIWVVTIFKYAFTHKTHVEAFKALLISYPVSWGITFAVLLVYFIITYRKIVSKENISNNDAVKTK